MLNHHSLTLLLHLSVLGLLGGEYLVNPSKNTTKSMYFVGKKARVKAITKREAANFIVAWIIHIITNNAMDYQTMAFKKKKN